VALKGHLYGRMGQVARADSVLTALRRGRAPWVPSEYLGIVALGRRDLDRAVSYFVQANAEGSSAMVFLHVDPMLDDLHGHPGFQELVRRVGVGELP